MVKAKASRQTRSHFRMYVWEDEEPFFEQFVMPAAALAASKRQSRITVYWATGGHPTHRNRALLPPFRLPKVRVLSYDREWVEEGTRSDLLFGVWPMDDQEAERMLFPDCVLLDVYSQDDDHDYTRHEAYLENSGYAMSRVIVHSQHVIGPPAARYLAKPRLPSTPEDIATYRQTLADWIAWVLDFTVTHEGDMPSWRSVKRAIDPQGNPRIDISGLSLASDRVSLGHAPEDGWQFGSGAKYVWQFVNKLDAPLWDNVSFNTKRNVIWFCQRLRDTDVATGDRLALPIRDVATWNRDKHTYTMHHPERIARHLLAKVFAEKNYRRLPMAGQRDSMRLLRWDQIAAYVCLCTMLPQHHAKDVATLANAFGIDVSEAVVSLSAPAAIEQERFPNVHEIAVETLLKLAGAAV